MGGENWRRGNDTRASDLQKSPPSEILPLGLCDENYVPNSMQIPGRDSKDHTTCTQVHPRESTSISLTKIYADLQESPCAK